MLRTTNQLIPIRFIRDLLVTGVGSMIMAIASLLPAIVQAQVNVSPLVISTQTRQGTARSLITLTNRGSQPVRMRLYAAPFTYTEDRFEVLESSPNDLSPYLIFSPRELVVEPGQQRRIRALARLLPSLPAGEYRAVIFAEPLRERTQDGGLRVNSRIGVTVYVRHNNPTFNLAVDGATYISNQKQISLQVSNTGNATIRPGVEWQLRQGDAKVLSGEVASYTVIAEGKRNIPLRRDTSEPLPAGTYQLTGNLVWGNPRNPEKLPFNLSLLVQ